jgi:GNAT superfamily N-acetyltransferase
MLCGAMQIRVGTSADIKRVLPLMKKHRALHAEWDPAQYTLKPDADKQFQRWLGPVTEDPRSLLILAEEHDGQLLGYLTAIVEKEIPIFACDEFAVIRGMWVEPHARHRGVGSGMVKRACDEIAAMGLPQLRIKTAAANDAGRKMLEKCGFRVATIDLLIELPEPSETPDDSRDE